MKQGGRVPETVASSSPHEAHQSVAGASCKGPASSIISASYIAQHSLLQRSNAARANHGMYGGSSVHSSLTGQNLLTLPPGTESR
jgi:hypothetical protein